MEPGKAYVRRAGAAIGWQEIGYISEDGFRLANPDTSPVHQPTFRQKSVNMTFTVKHKDHLEFRAFVRMMMGPGVRLPSLIHHGRKRRRK